MIKPIHLLSAIGFLMSSLAIHASNPVTYDTSKWTIHSAFENQPRKILDTPDVTYFLVHQHLYSLDAKCKNSSNLASGAIFMFDKKNPEAGMQDLANIAHFSGFDIQLLNYNTVTGELVIAYRDGGVDFISKDKKTTYIDDIKNRILPGATEITAINFDQKTGDTWFGTKRGFVHLDAATHEVIHSPQWDDAVTDITPVGDNVIAAVGKQILIASGNSNLALRASYAPAKLSGTTSNIGTIAFLMPLGNKSFATINTSGLLHKYYSDGTSWNVTHEANTDALSTKYQPSQLSSNYVINDVEHTVTPTSEGYYIGSTDYAYIVKKPDTPDGDASVYRITLPAEGKNVFNGSYDLETFWFFGGPRKFVSRELHDSEWSDIIQTPPFNAPLTSRDSFFFYSPTQGLVMVNRNPQRLDLLTAQTKSALIATYKNGKWTDKSPIYNRAYLSETNSSAATAVNNCTNMNKWPVGNPNGAFLDPINPNVVHLGSLWEGFASVYIDDPKKNPHKVVHKAEGSFSSFKASQILDILNSNYWVTPISAAGSDANGVIWFYHDKSQNSFDYGKGANLLFFYSEPGDREAKMSVEDPKAVREPFAWKRYEVKANLKPDYWDIALPLCHASNQNKLIHTNFEGDYDEGNVIRIIDHNGTISDTSDDKVEIIKYFRLPNGALYPPTEIHDIKENPINGDIAFTGFINTFIVNLKDPIVDGVIDAHNITFTGETGMEVEFRPSAKSNYALYDDYGRLWVTTPYNGVMGVSADGKSIIANFNSQNSPIGSNDVRGLGWNPETKSLFISAQDVVCEVRIDDPASTGASGDASIDAPCAVPENVMPEFGGMVAFHNIPTGVALRIRDSKGNTVREIESTFTGIAHWDLLDTEGKLVKSDRYTVTDASGNNTFEPIILPVIR